ncbi:MAG: ribbon-helix-helix domain-containing protein [Cyanobacteria bacterium]|nr:ribbon-helix-helix domain-containing protein [Cyanobacteriota bacterium]
MVRSSPLAERVTVTMPSELVAGIDRIEANRSRFIAEAVRHELQRRQRLELLRSLEAPHPDSAATAALGLADWAEALPEGDSDLLDPSAGEPVHWRPESGWQHAGSPESQP